MAPTMGVSLPLLGTLVPPYGIYTLCHGTSTAIEMILGVRCRTWDSLPAACPSSVRLPPEQAQNWKRDEDFRTSLMLTKIVLFNPNSDTLREQQEPNIPSSGHALPLGSSKAWLSPYLQCSQT